MDRETRNEIKRGNRWLSRGKEGKSMVSHIARIEKGRTVIQGSQGGNTGQATAARGNREDRRVSLDRPHLSQHLGKEEAGKW
jgi:hypothetical protein